MMFLKLKLRTFWILLLVLSSLWVASVFGPLVYAVLSPSADLWEIVQALQGRGTPPLQAAATVQEVLDDGGQLGRAIHVAHYAGVGLVVRNGVSHTTKRIEDSYLAWFEKAPKATILVVRRDEVNGTVQDYQVGSTEPAILVRGYAPPLLAWAISLYLVIKRKSPLLSDPPR